MDAESPLVHRTVRTGGVLLAVGAAQFVAALLWVQDRFSGFNPWTTTVTSLGGTYSVWAFVFDASLIVLGVLGALGMVLSWSAFDPAPSRGLGVLILLVASAAAAVCGAFLAARGHLPSSAVTAAAGVAVVAAGVGLAVLSFAMHQHGRWRASRAYTFGTGIVMVGAAALVIAHVSWGLGSGGLERVVIAAALLWALVEGVHLAVLHRFAPGLPVKVASA